MILRINLKRINFLFIFFIFHLTHFFAENTKLPLTLPFDVSGMLVSSFHQTNSYLVKIKYSYSQYREKFPQENYSLIFPIPSSTESQIVIITGIKNFQIKEIVKDKFGNTAVITEPINDIEKKEINKDIEITLNIICNSTKYSFPKNFSYNVVINKNFNTFLNQPQKNNKKLILIEHKWEKSQSFEEIMQFIKKYKDKINKSKDRLDRIYDEKIIELYPVPRIKYYEKAIDLFALLTKQKINGRILFGWNVPNSIDLISRDFIIEIYLPNKGFMLIDKELNLFINKGSFISAFFQYPDLNDYNKQGYIGVIENDKIIFLNEKISFTAGVLVSKKTQDSRYDNTIDYKKSFVLKDHAIDQFIIQDSFIHQENNTFVLMKYHSDNNGRIYKIEPVQKYLKDMVLCTTLNNHKPVNPGLEFYSNKKIYCYFKLNKTNSKKICFVKWIKPDGEIQKSNKFEIPGNWGYYYTNITPSKKGWEKGLWAIEIYLFGKLELRKHFIIK